MLRAEEQASVAIWVRRVVVRGCFGGGFVRWLFVWLVGGWSDGVGLMGMRTKVEIVAIFAVFGCVVGCFEGLLRWCDGVVYCAIIELAMSEW